MSIFRMAERLSGRWPDSQGFCGVRDFDEPHAVTVKTLTRQHGLPLLWEEQEALVAFFR